MEEWVRIKGFPKHSVSDLGQVRYDTHEHLIQPRVNQYGAAYVGLMQNGVQVNRSLSLLVANAFLVRGGASFGTAINLNGDRMDCRVDNLMWRPRWFARKYNAQFKEAYPYRIEDRIRCLQSGERFRNSFEAACRYGLLESDVVASIDYMTYTWPTYQVFELA